MKLSSSRLLLATLLSLGFASPGQSQTVMTDPVGFITINLPANSDTFVNVPLRRPQEYAGLVGSVAGSVITAAGTPGWSASQFVYAQATQPKTYYVFVASGPKEGCFYTITGNTATTVTLDLAGDDISAVTGGANAAKFQIIPYDTLGTIFPAGQGIQVSTSFAAGANRKSEILIPDQQTVGTNLAASKAYFYYLDGNNAANSGWRASDALAVKADDDILYPDTFFIVRQKAGAPASSITVMGGVQMNALQVPLNRLSTTVNQDNAVALPIASSLTLRQTNLFQSGAFVGSPSLAGGSNRKDELLVYDNALVAQNKSNSKSYFYYTGTGNGGPGWRESNDLLTPCDDTAIVISSSTAIVIRKKATGTVGSSFWTVKPPYVP